MCAYGQGGSSLLACSALYALISLRQANRTKGQTIKPTNPVRKSVTAVSRSVIPCIIFYHQHHSNLTKYLQQTPHKLISDMFIPSFQPPNNLPSNHLRFLCTGSAFKFRRQLRLRLAFLLKPRRKDICGEITTHIDIIEQAFFAEGIGQHTNCGFCGSIGCVAWNDREGKQRGGEHDMSFGCVGW